MLHIAYLLIDEITSVNLVSINYMTYIYHVVQALGDWPMVYCAKVHSIQNQPTELLHTTLLANP